jgi:hypothetical protein
VTIAIGILARDGVVLAADTQVGQQDYLKTGQTKIVIGRDTDHPERGYMAVTGAGTVSYVDSIKTELLDLFMDNGDVAMDEIEDQLKNRVKTFYSDHVLPFANYDYRERPDFSLLVAATRGNEWQLWATDKNTVRRGIGYDAVGAGAMYANILLSRVSMSDLDVRAARLLAAYVIYHVKECVDGCGMGTHIVALRSGNVTLSTQEEVDAMDRVFADFDQVESATLHYVLHGVPEIEDKKIAREISKFVHALRSAVNQLPEEISDITSSTDHT